MPNLAYWLQRWQREETGWHQASTNPLLIRHFDALGLAPGQTVFVPLCGKSRDMLWLAEHGYPVLGVEVSKLAVEAFFDEAGLVPTVEKIGDHVWYEAGLYRIACGDYYRLRREDLADVGAVYDRASLIAMGPDERRAYVRHARECLPGAAPILLITIEYPIGIMSGPPFAVHEEEVRALFSELPDREVRLVHRASPSGDVLSISDMPGALLFALYHIAPS